VVCWLRRERAGTLVFGDADMKQSLLEINLAPKNVPGFINSRAGERQESKHVGAILCLSRARYFDVRETAPLKANEYMRFVYTPHWKANQTEDSSLFAQRRRGRREKPFSSSLSASSAVLCKGILHFEENSHAAILHHEIEEHEGKCPAQWRKIFIPASVFVVEICYLQFPRFGWGFAALCLCASNPTRSIFTQRERFIASPSQYKEFCPAPCVSSERRINLPLTRTLPK
jgi:hypothetical protein